MDTQNKQHPIALHLAALALGKLKPEVAEKVQSHLDGCDTCRRYVSETPRHELAEVIKQARHKPASHENTQATGLSGTIGGATEPQLAHPTSDAKPQAAGSSSANRVEHGVSEKKLPPDLFAQSKYRIVRLLGRGGMGTVYEAEHVRMRRAVAIKVINPELVDHPQALARFEEEIRAVASLDHANIARAFDAENIGTLQVFVMEFIRGQTLYEFLRSRGRLTVVEACRCIRQALNGLQHAHEHGRVHRDLKPQNLMLARDTGQIKILDFGLSKAVSENRHSHGLTGSNAMMGTCAYLAPEQALDAASADIRADIYSLGCTLYLLLSGVLPFNYDSATKLLLAHQNETALPLHMICADVPEALSNLVAQMLDKDPATRPQTPREAADALLPFARGDGAASLVAASKFASRGAGAGRRVHWRTWVGVATSLLAIFGVGAWAAGVFSDRTPLGTITADNAPTGDSKSPEVEQLGGDAADEFGANTGVPPGFETEPGFVELFNRKDTDDWKTHPSMPGNWRVENTVLKSGTENTHLYSMRDDYQNVHLRIQLRMRPKTRCALYVRGEYGPKYPGPDNVGQWANGLEVCLCTSGEPVPITAGLWAGGKRMKEVGDRWLPADQWIQVDIISQGDHSEVLLDGQPVMEHEDAEHSVPKQGHIILQSQYGEVEFARVEVKELPADSRPVDPPKLGPPVARAARSIKGDWRIDGGELISETPGARSICFGDPSWRDFDLTYDCLRDNTVAAMHCAVRDDERGNLVTFAMGAYGGRNMWCEVYCHREGKKFASKDRRGRHFNTEANRWYSVRLSCRGDEFTAMVNGLQVGFMNRGDYPRGYIGFGGHKNGGIRFRNVKVTAPDGTILWEGLPDLDVAAARS